MTDYDYRRCACSVIFLSDAASQDRLHSQAGVITAGHGLPIDSVRLIARYGGQISDRSEGEEIAERVFRRISVRLAHLFKDFVAKQRNPACARLVGIE